MVFLLIRDSAARRQDLLTGERAVVVSSRTRREPKMWAKVWARFPRPSGAFRLVSSFPRLKPWAKFQGPCRGRGATLFKGTARAARRGATTSPH